MAYYHDCLMIVTYQTTHQNESLTVETDVTFVYQEGFIPAGLV